MSLGTANGEEFDIQVAITDTDLMERGALLMVFPWISLLICKFHIRQSWRNHRNKEVKGDSPLHVDVKKRLRQVEERLVQTLSITAAHEVIADEGKVLEAVKQQGHSAIVEKAIKHLNGYLLTYWCTENLWSSWSDYGRQVAAKILGSTDGLKKGHTCMGDTDPCYPWRYFSVRKEGGSKATGRIPNLAYLQKDESRDIEATQLLSNNQIGVPTVEKNQLTFICHSSLALDVESQPVSYEVYLSFNNTAGCTCPDFSSRGGACKHIRAALLQLDTLQQRGIRLPPIHLPDTIEEARVCQSQNVEADLPQGTAPAIRSLTQKAAVAAEDALRESEDAFLDDLESVSTANEATDEMEEGNNGGNEEESDNTDTPDDNDEFDRFDIISIQATSKGAFDEQTIARVFYELEGVTPKVGELTTYLRQCRSLPDQGSSTRAVVFTHALGSLQNELLRLAGHSQSGHAARLPLPITPPRPTLSLESRGVKRTIVDLLGASPEKRSKRKESYRPH
ncbi:hypothetical protein JB92DRAFT_2826336 [Gautieria morchelliformis]|nr:hypothetical protein JB92DRAFT_2826336 [Gautieria morchelliformis]